jgi:Leucine-rich repeat (LRR) protein
MEEAERRVHAWWSATDVEAMLDLQGLGLDALPPLPLTLRHLNASNNKITTLPKLGKYFLTLSCSNNALVDLPNLPSSLRVLICNNNNLQQLPPLPRTLIHLSCSSNHLKELPASLQACVNLKYLDCEYNAIRHLPTLSDSLETMCIGRNGMVALQCHRPKALTYLSSFQNQFEPFIRYEISIPMYWDNVLRKQPRAKIQ